MVDLVTPQQAADWLANDKAVLIDVREADEFKSAHIVYAYSLPLAKLQQSFAQLSLPAEKTVIFHCAKGGRGEKAVNLIEAGGRCKNPLYNLEGGISGWQKEGLPVIGKSGGISLFRQVQMVVGVLIAMLVIFGFMGCKTCFIIAGLVGLALFLAGLTGWCGMAILLSKMPWNK